jgi:glyoxylase-like metal-dependent hydrolase (beta-lactamase superfamily II)
MSDPTAESSRSRRQKAERALWRAERRLILDDAEDLNGIEGKLREEVARAALEEKDQADFSLRLEALLAAARGGQRGLKSYGRKHGLGGVQLIRTSGDTEILRLTAETFPNHINYIYAIKVEGHHVTWDAGSGFGDSRKNLEESLQIAERGLDFRFDLQSVEAVMLSHGHIDHFGDVGWLAEKTNAPIWMHELDARVVEQFKELTVLSSRDMRDWLRHAGVRAEKVEQLITMYLASKELFEGASVGRRLRHRSTAFGDRLRFIHTPGHCPGHLCLRIDDAILVGDQVLDPISPHISPQALNPHNGLERYLFGLGRLRLQEGVRHVLPAHYDAIPDLGARIDAIALEHGEGLTRIMDIAKEPATVSEIAKALYGKKLGYGVLLAILEAGTLVEYLHQLGSLRVDNIAAIEKDPEVPARYKATGVVADAPIVN